MQALFNSLNIQNVPLWAIAAVLLAAALIAALVAWRNEIHFTCMRFWYAMPVIGKLRSPARDDARIGDSLWFKSERELCSDFYRYHPERESDAEFKRATSYLQKAQELRRRELPLAGWLIVMILLTAESLSFGILLAGYIAQNAAYREQQWLGYLGATVLAIVLLVLTHVAGRQLYRNSLLSKAREWYLSRSASERDIPLRPMAGITLDSNELDDAAPPYLQLANRINEIDHSGGRFQSSFLIPLVTLVIVGIIGAGTFYIREKVYDSLDTAKTLGADTNIDSAHDTGATPGSEDINLILGKQTTQAQTRGSDEIKHNAEQAAVAVFGVLTVLFIAMQVIGAASGFFFGFSGNESKAAAMVRSHFGTVDEYLSYHRRRRDFVARIAQSWLERLQRRMKKTTICADFDKGISNRSFRQYAMDQMEQRAQEQMRHETLHAAPRQGQSFANATVPAVAGSGAKLPSTDSPEASDELAEQRRRIRDEVRLQLKREHEAMIRAEIETEERSRMGLGRLQ